jgi:hypothetical protein
MSERSPSLQPEAAADSAVAEERRCFVRFPVDLEALVTPLGAETTREAEKAWAARLVNISQGGIALSMTRRFERGTGLLIDLLLPTGQASPPLRARVIHVARAPSGNWIVGCAFLRPMSEEDLTALLEQG